MKNKTPTMHPTGVQYPSMLEGIGPVERTALKYIQLFDEAMKALTIQTLIGTEQEVLITPKSDQPVSQSDINPKNYPPSNKFAEEMEKAVAATYASFSQWENTRRLTNQQSHGTPEPKLLTGKNHPYLERFEYTGRGNHGRLEAINRPLPPAMAAHCCASNIRMLYAMSEEGRKEQEAKGKTPEGTLQALIQKGPQIEKVRFVPVGEASRAEATIYSQHINTSQHIPAMAPLMSEPLIPGHANIARFPGYRTAKARMLEELTMTDMPVMLANPHSYARMSRGKMDDHHLDWLNRDAVYTYAGTQKTARTEFRIPDASSNPYLSVLMDMAASYYTVNLLAKIANRPELPFCQQIAHGAAAYESYCDIHAYAFPDRKQSKEYTRTKELLAGTPLAQPFTLGITVREIYEQMLTCFREKSTLLPMMQKVAPHESEKELSDFKSAIIEAAKNNLLDPQKPEVGSDKHYVRPR